MQRPAYYCVYRFHEEAEVDLDDVKALVATVRENRYRLPYKDGSKKYIYVITAIDRMHNESEPKILKVKL